MNSSVKGIIYFTSGLALGALGMYFGVKRVFEAKADEEIAEVKRVYEEKIEAIEEHKSSKDGEIKGPEVIDVKERVKKLNNKPDLMDYTKYFKDKGERLDGVSETLRDAKTEADKEGLSEEELAERELDAEGVDFAEMEGPQDDEPYTDEEDRDQSLEFEDYQLNGEHKKALAEDRAPFEIEPSDFELTCANYEKTSLVWYHFDQILANEEGESVDEHLLVGDVISDSGFDSNDQDVLYVRNDKIMADYEITKVYESFGIKD